MSPAPDDAPELPAVLLRGLDRGESGLGRFQPACRWGTEHTVQACVDAARELR